MNKIKEPRSPADTLAEYDSEVAAARGKWEQFTGPYVHSGIKENIYSALVAKCFGQEISNHELGLVETTQISN